MVIHPGNESEGISVQKKNTSLLLAFAMFLVGILVSYAPAAGAARRNDIKYPAYMHGSAFPEDTRP